MAETRGFLRIADTLRLVVTQMPPSTRIPTETDLASWFGVDRWVITQALRVLKTEGLLMAAKRGGTFTPPAQVQITGGAQRIAEALGSDRDGEGPWDRAVRAVGRTGHGKIISVYREAASAELAQRLDIQPGDVVVVRRRNQVIEGEQGEPDTVATMQWSYLPLALVDGSPLAEPADLAVYDAMVIAGLIPHLVDDLIEARPARQAELDPLAVTAGSVVFDIWRVMLDADGRPLEALHVIASAWRTRYRYQTPLILPPGRRP